MARRSSKASAPAQPETRRSWRDHAVGVFIALHLLAVILKAIPTPEDGMNRETWKDPSVQAELHAWWDRARVVGFRDVTYDRFEQFLWELALRYCSLRAQTLRPFDPYYIYAGTFQAWPMFVAPQRFPTRFSLDVEQDGRWQNAFTEDDLEHHWMATEFGDTRFRSVFFRLALPNFGGELSHFADWVALRAAHDYPTATRARVRMFHYRSPTPEEALRGAPLDGTERVLERDIERRP